MAIKIMSINTNISFSQFVGQHLNSASGFNIQDYIYECIDNSFDANSTNTIVNFIQNPKTMEHYLVIADNGSGSDSATKFFSVGDSVIKKTNKDGVFASFSIGVLCMDNGFNTARWTTTTTMVTAQQTTTAMAQRTTMTTMTMMATTPTAQRRTRRHQRRQRH
jgi:hypothetical protein